MCGILRYISFKNNKKNNKLDERNFKKALDLQMHRGPDGYGIYGNEDFLFGH